jgi:hypothetical protein
LQVVNSHPKKEVDGWRVVEAEGIIEGNGLGVVAEEWERIREGSGRWGTKYKKPTSAPSILGGITKYNVWC